MQIVNFNALEKETTTKYITNKINDLNYKLASIDSQTKLVTEWERQLPSAARPMYKADLNKKREELTIKKTNVKITIKRLERFKEGIASGIDVKKVYRPFLKELYEKESKVYKNIEKKYSYYPRLKLQKEKVLYEFANKLKDLLEVENVRIA